MKDCLVKEYKYSVLIMGLPNNMKKDTIIQIAQKVLHLLKGSDYTMSACDYIVNPNIIKNADDEKLYQDSKKKYYDEHIDFKIDYDGIKDDHNFKHIFKK